MGTKVMVQKCRNCLWEGCKPKNCFVMKGGKIIRTKWELDPFYDLGPTRVVYPNWEAIKKVRFTR